MFPGEPFMSNRTELSLRAFSSAALIVVLFSSLSYAATADRISGTLSAGQTVALQGHVHPQARPEFDRGPADPALRFGSIMLLTVPTATQQKDLNRLLAEQQDRKSPNYHKWLDARAVGRLFRVEPQRRRTSSRLGSEGRDSKRHSRMRGRNWIRFSGTASQVQSAFGTEIHRFNVNGEMHVANATSPKIPRALVGVVTGVRGLDDFFLKPMNHPRARPYYTDGTFYAELIAPGDIATMYDLNALYTKGIDGTGQTVAVIGQTDVYQADLVDFRTGFGLSLHHFPEQEHHYPRSLITACSDAHFQYVLVGTDPGVPTGNFDPTEADSTSSGQARLRPTRRSFTSTRR